MTVEQIKLLHAVEIENTGTFKSQLNTNSTFSCIIAQRICILSHIHSRAVSCNKIGTDDDDGMENLCGFLGKKF